MAATAASEHWRGVAQTAFESSVEESAPDLLVLADSLDATASALFTYGGQVARIKDEQEQLELRRARLEAEQEELTACRDTYTGLGLPHDMDLAQVYQRELDEMGPQFAQVEEDWEGLVRRRERADADFVADLGTSQVRGKVSAFTSDYFGTTSPAQMLLLLGAMSAADLRVLEATHPEVLDRLRRASPTAASAWWTGLDDSVKERFVRNLPTLIGSLGGVPADVRADANELLAEARLAELTERFENAEAHMSETPSNVPYDHESRVADYLELERKFGAERDYLKSVVEGEVQLYLYQPELGRIIEMYGDLDNANVIQSFMPGTNTNLESLYTSDDKQGVSSLTRDMVDDPADGVRVAGFVVVQGRFPMLDPILTEGPQLNHFASTLGSRYAGFVNELSVIAPGTPVVSVEHSFGSAVGGKAESAGATFDTRYALAGIGMTSEWERNLGTDYIASQGPMDVNRFLDGHQLGGIGYAITPSEENGFDERPSGMPLMPRWQAYAPPLNDDLGIRGIVKEALEQHNAIISPDEKINGTVKRDLRLTLQEVAIP